MKYQIDYRRRNSAWQQVETCKTLEDAKEAIAQYRESAKKSIYIYGQKPEYRLIQYEVID